jgi:hypothetical protein
VPDWLPDWRDASAYPGPATLLYDWAWEFLRRNPEYQRRWCEWNAPRAEGERRRRIRLSVFKQEFGVLLPREPQSTEAPTFEWDIGVVERPPRSRLPDDQEFFARISLQPGQAAVVFDLRLQLNKQLAGAEEWLKGHAKLRKGLGELEEFPLETPRVREFPGYLRLLDADAAGVTNKKVMASVIYPELEKHVLARAGYEKVRYGLYRAKKLRDGGYRSLIV